MWIVSSVVTVSRSLSLDREYTFNLHIWNSWKITLRAFRSHILLSHRTLSSNIVAISGDFFPTQNFLYCFTRVRYLRDGNSRRCSQTLHFARTNKLLITVCSYCLCIAAPRVYPAFALLRQNQYPSILPFPTIPPLPPRSLSPPLPPLSPPPPSRA